MDWTSELGGNCFRDERLEKRFYQIIGSLGKSVGFSIQSVYQNWADTKAAYRFLSNERVNPESILKGHMDSTKLRMSHCDGNILVLHDTSEFTYRRNESIAEKIGSTRKTPLGSYKSTQRKLVPTCGILLHASLAITEEGVPLGLCATKFWSRDAKTMKGVGRRMELNPTRIPIEQKESLRWLDNMRTANRSVTDPSRIVHVGDRESDIFEFFSLAESEGCRFVVRACHDRCAEESYISEEISKKPVRFRYRTNY